MICMQRDINSDNYDLISFLQESKFEHLAEFYESFIPLIKSRVMLYSGSTTEFDDLVQEASIGFLEAVKSYKIGESSFYGFAKLCIDRKLFDYYKHASRKGAIPRSSMVSLDDSAVIVDNTDTEALLIAQDEYNRLLKLSKNVLSSLEYDVLCLFCNGLSYKEISNRLNIPSKSVDNAMQRIRAKLKKLV